MSRLFLLLALLPACVPPDPPLRPMGEIPLAPARDLLFQTERQALEAVQDALKFNGIPKVGQIQTEIAPLVSLPLADGDAVVVGRFLVAPPAARGALSDAGAALTGAPLTLVDWSEPDVVSASLTFQVAWLGIAFGQAAAKANNSHDRANAWTDQRRAMDLIWPLLHTLVDQSRLPQDAIAVYPRLLQALLDALPAEVLAHIPADPAVAEALYNAAAAHALPNQPPTDTDSQIAVGLALRYALAATQSPPVPLVQTMSAFDPDPEGTLHAVVAGLATPPLAARKVQWNVNKSHVIGWFDGTPLEFGLDVDESGDGVEGWLWQPIEVPPGKEADVLRLVNLANLEHGPTRMELQKDRLVLYAPRRDVPDGGPASSAMMGDLLSQADVWFAPIEKVARGELTLDAARRAAVHPAPKEGG